ARWLLAEGQGAGDETGGYGGGDATDSEWDGDGGAAIAEEAPLDDGSTAAAAGADGGASDSGGPESPGKPAHIFTHEVRRGETLSQIAAAYGVDVETIVVANELVNPDRLRPGDRLLIPSVRGALHVVRRGESLWDIARAYQVSMDTIAEANGLERPDRIRVGERLVIPGAQAIAYARQRDAVVGRDGSLLRNFDWPVRGRISSRFGPRWGRMHYGLDIAVPEGTPVRAAAGGIVRFSGWRGGYGYLVIIDHGNGVETRYAHNSRLTVRVGQRVARGAVVAYSGNTGNSTGPHVHFEIRRRGRAVNPEQYLRR